MVRLRHPAAALLSLTLTGALLAPPVALAQELGSVISPVLAIEPERLFVQSAFGQRVAREIEAEQAVLAAENRQIEAELAAEEKTLTEKRPTMTPEDFRAVADAFDERVQFIRREQDKKALAISQRGEEARIVFLTAAQPVLSQIMRDSQASVIMERQSIFLSAESINITDQAIQLLDAAIGDGSSTAPLDE